MGKVLHRIGRQPMATPQSALMAAGETLNDLAARITRPVGEMEALSVTAMVMYAAVKNSQGEVEAMVIPYRVDYSQPAPRDLNFGVYSEAQNPEWAYAPLSILNRLTGFGEGEASEWRRRCWENLQMRSADQTAWMRGDVLKVERALASNKGVQQPGHYVLLESVGDYAKIQRIRDNRSAGALEEGQAAIVKGLASVARKVRLDSDPTSTLSNNPSVVSFGLVRVMSDSEYGSHYVLLGRTAQGGTVPLAKANADEREAMMERIWAVSGLRGERMRNYESDPLYRYAADNGLAEAMVSQRATGRADLFDNLEIKVGPAAVVDFARDEDLHHSPSI